MNARQEFAARLKRLSLDELELELARTQRAFQAAKRKGYCSLEAVLYFDVQQIQSAIKASQEAQP